MGEPIGTSGLGDFARSQLEAARIDPRSERLRGSMIADYWDAMEEAERLRQLGTFGLYELKRSLEREERDLGVTRASEQLTYEQQARLQAAWERAEMAQAEIDNEIPHLHAMALISMNSALDALVEELVPAVRYLKVRSHAAQIVSDAAARCEYKLSDDRNEALVTVVMRQLEAKLPRVTRLRGSGSKRYEQVLACAGLQAPSDRPIPHDLDQALTRWASCATSSCIVQAGWMNAGSGKPHCCVSRCMNSCALTDPIFVCTQRQYRVTVPRFTNVPFLDWSRPMNALI